MNKFTLYFADGKTLTSEKTLIMGVLNATPDSFSDGGEIFDHKVLEQRVKQMIESGADILDVGGESTRPGHQRVSTKEELKRVLPVIKAIRLISPTIPISIDTQKATVAQAALEARASFINDISSLSDPEMSKVATKASCSIILMRNQATSEDVVNDTRKQLAEITIKAKTQGLSEDRILLDPGVGFGDLAKGDFSALPGASPEANLLLIKNISDYSNNLPVVVGGSRKRFIGKLTGATAAKERLGGSIAVAILAKQAGAAIVRVHDVSETIQAFKIIELAD